MTMTIPSPLAVAQNRAQRLVREAAPVVRYTTSTGDAPSWTPTSGQIHRAKQALREIAAMQTNAPDWDGGYGCCPECDMGPEWNDKVHALWAIVERVPRDLLLPPTVTL